jgi:GDP-L-fucose synthase
LGSSCIYPRLAPQPLKESSLLEASLEPTNEAYAIAKIANIKLCKYYNQQYGTNFISVMPTNQYGKNDNFNMETAHLLPMLIRRFHLAKMLRENNFAEIKRDLKKHPIGFGYDCIDVVSKNNAELELILNKLGAYREKVVVWGDGSVRRELMSSDDLANACVCLMENENCNYKNIGELINITSGEDILLRDLFVLVKSIINFAGDIEYDIMKPNGTPRKLMDATKINSIPGFTWKPKISLEEGIRELYQWYKGLTPSFLE